MIRFLDFIANLPGIRYLLALSASRRQEAITITVGRHGAQYMSVYDAVMSIKDASPTKMYVIQVDHGSYFEQNEVKK